jgi:HAD superfamily hydrolase (TIGR01509 family)
MDFKGAIFDLDGTLLDSMGVWADIDVDFLARRGIDVPPDYITAVTPMGFMEAAVYTIQRFGLDEKAEDIIEEWNQMSIDAYSHKVALKPKAKEYLLSLKEKGVKLAVATALPPGLYEPALKNNGIYELFDAFSFLSEVERGKGFPDIYLIAAERLGLKPKDCIVFEDIYAGICGAKAGGFRTCGVYDSYSDYEKEKILNTADLFIESFSQLL